MKWIIDNIFGESIIATTIGMCVGLLVLLGSVFFAGKHYENIQWERVAAKQKAEVNKRYAELLVQKQTIEAAQNKLKDKYDAKTIKNERMISNERAKVADANATLNDTLNGLLGEGLGKGCGRSSNGTPTSACYREDIRTTAGKLSVAVATLARDGSQLAYDADFDRQVAIICSAWSKEIETLPVR